MEKKNYNSLIVIALILLASLSRVVPHQPNFTPVLAIMLFAGVYLPKKYVLAVPLLVMAFTDFHLGFHNTMLFTWGSFILIGLLGLVVKKKKNIVTVLGSSLLGGILFYVVTNFGVFIMNAWYPHTWEGLLQCYVAGIPFFRNTLLSSVVYTSVLFGSYEIINLFYVNRVNKTTSQVAVVVE